MLPSVKKAGRLSPASRSPMLSAIYERGNRVAWITVAVTVVLVFYAVIYAFPNAPARCPATGPGCSRAGKPSLL